MTPGMIPIRDSPEGASFQVRVQPRAPRTKIAGILGEGDHAALKVALAAPPVDGRANQALIDFFAGLVNVPRSHIEILTGAQSRTKVLRVRGKTAADVRAALE